MLSQKTQVMVTVKDGTVKDVAESDNGFFSILHTNSLEKMNKAM
jgi:hypothetical protein